MLSAEDSEYKYNKSPDDIQFCNDCRDRRISYGWCKDCQADYMGRNFMNWSSGNQTIDELIQFTQINATQPCDYLEWIDFKEFELVQFVAEGGYSTVYRAEWLRGPSWNWDEVDQLWCCNGPMTVALKRLKDSQNISSDYLKQVEAHYRCLQSGSLADCFGITRDETGGYMFVMRFYENGDLYQYLDKSNGIISWRDMVDMLWGVAGGLDRIHSEDLYHSNLHGGNLLIEDESVSTDARIADVGLHGPSDESRSSQIYGVLPYIAPEVLRGEMPSKAADIYSFGIIMCTLATGIRPWSDRPHDFNLAKEICLNNLRPNFDGVKDEMPRKYRELITKCWDANPLERPTASQLNELLGEWITYICDDPNPSEIADQFTQAEEKRWELIGKHTTKASQPKIHRGASYISRPIKFVDFLKVSTNT